MTHNISAAATPSSQTSWRIGATLGFARRHLRKLLLFTPAVLLTACTVSWHTDYGEPLDAAATANWRVSSVQVLVPETLTVSNENRFAPSADIVWHGDPLGDRRAQVQAIIRDAARSATANMRGSQPVTLAITLQRFHGVTPITQARAPEAVYNISFSAQVRDARSGAALTPPTHFDADMPAKVREDALEASQFGKSEKERVTEHVAAAIRGWLGIGPDVRGSFTSVGF